MSAYRPDARREIARQRNDLSDLIARAELQLDLDARADLAKYACIRLVGFLEQSLLTVGIELVRRQTSGPPQSFALSHLDKSFNPNTEALLKYIGRFHSDWRTSLEDLLRDDERAQILTSLVGVRNQIAHGRNQSVGIETVKEYRKVVDLVVDHLLERFSPLPR